MERNTKDFYSFDQVTFIVSKKEMEKREDRNSRGKSLFETRKIGVLGLGDFGIRLLKFWKENYRNTYWISGYDKNEIRAKGLWANSNLMTDFAKSYVSLYDHISSPQANNQGEDRVTSSIFILSADTQEDNDMYFEGLEPHLRYGDIVIDYTKKEFLLKQNDKAYPYKSFSFDLLNFITQPN